MRMPSPPSLLGRRGQHLRDRVRGVADLEVDAEGVVQLDVHVHVGRSVDHGVGDQLAEHERGVTHQLVGQGGRVGDRVQPRPGHAGGRDVGREIERERTPTERGLWVVARWPSPPGLSTRGARKPLPVCVAA